MRLNPILSLIVCASFSFLIPAAVASTPARVAIVNATAAPGSMKGLSSKNHERSNDDVNTLVLGKAIERDIQGGAIHSYLIALSPGQYIRLVVAPRGIDVGIKLLDPRGRTLTAMGAKYSFLGEHQNALDSHRKALELLRRIGNREGEAATLNSIAYAYEDLGERETALDFYDQAFRLYRDMGNRQGEGLSIYYVGRIHFSLGNKTRALECFSQGISLIRAVGDRRMWRQQSWRPPYFWGAFVLQGEWR